MIRLILLILFSASLIYSQYPSISGKILNEKNEPLSFANIVVVGKSIGVITKQDGSFTLSGDFSENNKLRISHIGFLTEEITIKDFSDLYKSVVMLKPSILTSQTVLVKASIAERGTTPVTFSKIDRSQLEESYINQDVPELLSYMPATTFYSEGGASLGYNYISIRGFDQRRISVAINGIPQNDPEDHNVYWVNLPGLLGSTELIQVQRGAGAGVIGYPSIGGSINIITSPFSDEPKTEFDIKAGSYNTRKYTAAFSSGLIDNKYSVYAKVLHLMSDGYRDRNWVDMKSYHLSAVRYDKNVTTQVNLYGGPIADGLVYTGLPKNYVKDRELRKRNYNYWEGSGDTFFAAERRADEIENFSQPHYELLNEFKVSDDVTINSALFLVIGQGFFDFDGSWADTNYFRLTKDNGFNTDMNPGNALIRATVKNNQWGWIPRVSIDHAGGSLVLGAELRFHNSKHFGNINYAENLPAGVTKNYQYYYYEGAKDIFNVYAHELYYVNERLSLLGELQLAYHNYSISNEKFVGTNFEIDNLFINPKLGLNYKFNDKFSSFLSFARVSREPRLKNYYDAAESSGGAVPQFNLNNDGSYNFDDPLVKPEVMNNIELGFNYEQKKFNASLNLFYMLFNDEIVSQGQVDRFGQPVTGNVDRTIHSGVEFVVNSKVGKILDFTFNGAYSQNYISEGKYFLSSKDFIDLKDNKIAGFPDLTFNAIIAARYKGLFAQLTGKYVGEFYSDNYDENLTSYLGTFPGFVDYSDNKVESYFVANLLASYEFELVPFLQSAKLFIQVSNLFDNLYTAHAIGKDFFPAAERHFLAGIDVRL
jgi:iron complex outermembrane receptor protein